MTKLSFEMAGVDWLPVPVTTECELPDGRMPRATHYGVWHFMGGRLRVYRLDDGRTVIDADDAEKFFDQFIGGAPVLKVRPAAASEAKPLLGLYSVSGAGKTKSALLLAKGFARDMSRVTMIETESGRGEAYADDSAVGGYQVISLRENFAPKVYGEAISLAEKSGAEVLIIDSASHEWEGVGGVIAMADANREDGKKGPLIWQRPKIDHQREFMLRLTQTPIPLVIVCMRAKFPMYEVSARHVQRWEDAGKPGGDKAKPKVGEWARAWELEPKQSDDILYEMFVHAWIDQDHKLHVTKTTLDEMREVFRDGEPITVATGERLAAWAKRKSPGRAGAQAQPDTIPGVEPPETGGPALITDAQFFRLENALKLAGVSQESFYARAKITRLRELPAEDFEDAIAWLTRRAGRA